MLIRVENLYYKYNKNSEYVLNDINLEIKPNSINLILGLNGSGKTSLIKSLVGVNDNYEGEIYYNNKNFKDIKIHERSKLISYVQQLNKSNDDIKVFDFLLLGTSNTIRFGKIPSSKEKQKVEIFSKKFGIENLLDKNLGQLSGGQKQLVNICCSCIQDSDIIFLDEPTSALDLKNQYLLLKTLKYLIENENKTIILTSHNPNHGLFLDCNVILISDGTICKIGQSNEIINVKYLKKIYGNNLCLSSDLEYNEISFKLTS